MQRAHIHKTWVARYHQVFQKNIYSKQCEHIPWHQPALAVWPAQAGDNTWLAQIQNTKCFITKQYNVFHQTLGMQLACLLACLLRTSCSQSPWRPGKSFHGWRHATSYGNRYETIYPNTVSTGILFMKETDIRLCDRSSVKGRVARKRWLTDHWQNFQVKQTSKKKCIKFSDIATKQPQQDNK